MLGPGSSSGLNSSRSSWVHCRSWKAWLEALRNLTAICTICKVAPCQPDVTTGASHCITAAQVVKYRLQHKPTFSVIFRYVIRVTNEHVRKTIVKHIGPYEDLLATVKRRKLKWYGHVTRSDGLTKVILQGTVEGSRRRGRQKMIWSDNITEWTGKSFAETQTMAHNRQEWRELTRKSIMTRPYGPSRS